MRFLGEKALVELFGPITHTSLASGSLISTARLALGEGDELAALLGDAEIETRLHALRLTGVPTVNEPIVAVSTALVNHARACAALR